MPRGGSGAQARFHIRRKKQAIFRKSAIDAGKLISGTNGAFGHIGGGSAKESLFRKQQVSHLQLCFVKL